MEITNIAHTPSPRSAGIETKKEISIRIKLNSRKKPCKAGLSGGETYPPTGRRDERYFGQGNFNDIDIEITHKRRSEQCKDHLVYESIRKPGFSRSKMSGIYQEYMDGGRKTSDRVNFKGQLALIVSGERRLKRIVRSQENQTLAQITTQLNDGASSTVSE
ncbi:HTH_Tnp_Tc3_2 domain-containing protein [Trichonephila clavipes]|nr:HTH_Tnp_Tc3_2 domain-containing protein [Trichonephila clavipes]